MGELSWSTISQWEETSSRVQASINGGNIAYTRLLGVILDGD